MMNDRYLFKAKRIDNEEWEIGYLAICPDGRTEIENACKNPPDSDPMWRNCLITHDVGPSTLCQCTGLKDKNGKLIWENDILSGHIDDSFPENETRKHVLWNENGWHTKEIESIDYEKLDNFDSENFEVIGNRFDNPKLLESEE